MDAGESHDGDSQHSSHNSWYHHTFEGFEGEIEVNILEHESQAYPKLKPRLIPSQKTNTPSANPKHKQTRSCSESFEFASIFQEERPHANPKLKCS